MKLDDVGEEMKGKAEHGMKMKKKKKKRNLNSVFRKRI